LVSVNIYIIFGVVGVLYEKLLTRCGAEFVEIFIIDEIVLGILYTKFYGYSCGKGTNIIWCGRLNVQLTNYLAYHLL
jgi:hypothetical protein